MTSSSLALESDAPNASSEPRTQPPIEPVRKSKVSRTREPSYREEPVLKNVTTRLRRETNELLTESALRQQLKKETPATRQDILEEALQEWFKRHGYKLQSTPATEE